MVSIDNCTYGIIGLGLMGGSFAKALKKSVIKNGKIFACDINQKALEEALLQGDIDKGFLPLNLKEMLSQCDIIICSLYPKATEKFILENMQYFKTDALITDIAGVKQQLINHIVPKLRKDITFIPGHPMAGSEREGYYNASEKIFFNRNYILLPLENTSSEKLSQLKEIITKLGFKQIIETTANNHDHKIAFTSQLCHIIASCLVESAEDSHITAFGGGSFEDLTRIAMINAPLWTELFLSNKDALINHLESFEKSLQLVKELLLHDNKEDLQKLLEEVRLKRIEMAQTDSSQKR